MEKYDLVTIVKVPQKDLERLIGEEGIIINVDEKWVYPYEIVFFSKNAQKFSLEEGILLWNDYHLEGI